MCLRCGGTADMRLRQGRARLYLLNRHPFLVTLTGIASIFSGLYCSRGIGIIVGVPLCSFGMLALRQARRMTAVRSKIRLVADGRPPVLYLRRFLYDGSEENESSDPPLWLAFVLPPLWLGILLLRRGAYEERLAAILDRFGPCVTLGRPYEELPEIGFLRVYATDDQWHATVQGYLDCTQLLIVRASRVVAALLWEIRQAVERVASNRVIIFLPFCVDPHNAAAQAEYTEFRLSVQDVFPKPLPEWQPQAVFIVFDESWNTKLIARRGTLERTFERLLAPIKFAAVDRYAGFWVRFAAAVFDVLAIGLVLVFLWLLFATLSRSLYGMEWALAQIDVWLWVLPGVILILFWRGFSASLGQLILGLRVVDLQTRQRPEVWQCVMRYFGCVICAMTFGLGFIFVGFDRRKQGWHDKLAQTLVVFHRANARSSAASGA